jgi:hypothetical protein
LRLGFGVGGDDLSVPVYTAILLTGLTQTTFPVESTPMDMIPLETTGETLVRRVNLSPESLAIPLSISSRVDGEASQSPIFPFVP